MGRLVDPVRQLEQLALLSDEDHAWLSDLLGISLETADFDLLRSALDDTRSLYEFYQSAPDREMVASDLAEAGRHAAGLLAFLSWDNEQEASEQDRLPDFHANRCVRRSYDEITGQPGSGFDAMRALHEQLRLLSLAAEHAQSSIVSIPSATSARPYLDRLLIDLTRIFEKHELPTGFSTNAGERKSLLARATLAIVRRFLPMVPPPQSEEAIIQRIRRLRNRPTE